jgi:hypothetical protein
LWSLEPEILELVSHPRDMPGGIRRHFNPVVRLLYVGGRFLGN